MDVRPTATQPAGVPASAPRPPPGSFKHCQPRGKHLCVKQEVHDVWDAVADAEILQKWKELLKKHNSACNPAGVPFKSRRSPEEDLDTIEEAQAESIVPRDGQYQDMAALKAGPAGMHHAFGLASCASTLHQMF